MKRNEFLKSLGLISLAAPFSVSTLSCTGKPAAQEESGTYKALLQRVGAAIA